VSPGPGRVGAAPAGAEPLRVSLTPLDFAAAGGATLVAGAINAMAGGGTLVSFPTLVALGVPALSANVTNTVALCPGYFSGAWAQREDLRHQRVRLRWLVAAAAVGGLTGSALLEVTPESTFRAAVPWLLVLSCLLLAGQDRVRRLVASRPASTTPGDRLGPVPAAADGRPSPADGPPAEDGRPSPADGPPAEDGRPADHGPTAADGRPSPWLLTVTFLGAIYGGFFGAGLGIMLLAVLGLFLSDTMLRVNALKQALQLAINILAAVFFAVSGHVRWELVPVMAVAAVIGGTVGGRFVRVVDPTWLRRAVVVFGLVVAADFWLTH
jgi:uncharacterized membrane protein YfcA